MPNRLAAETSPYLLQHAHNPVDWYPWGEEAFERARAEDRPLLLSVGYSACHWCHVMERESFEDEETARVMNEHFINVKVDREERPDVDSIYMTAVQSMTGHGGWPMTVFLTPDGAPFYGGTYFPPEPRHGLPSFRQLLGSVADAFHNRRGDVDRSAASLRLALEQSTRVAAPADSVGPALLDEAAPRIAAQYDARNGGFGGAPKFPQPMALDFMLRHYARTGDTHARDIVLLTLRTMARGGIHDQLGGGFHRYSVDAHWLVPHFEKMLYDNALLARLYLHAWQATKDEELRDVAERTLGWVLREMRLPGGGFCSALDADSEGEEGRFYVWTPDQIDDVLGADDGPVFRRFYDVTAGGNFEGRSILHVVQQPQVAAAAAGMSVEALHELLTRGRTALYDARAQRVWPARDDKVLTSWNAMMLQAFAVAAYVLDHDEHRAVAVRNAEFLLTELMPRGRLMRTWSGGSAKIDAFLEDHALLADALLSLYEATFDVRWVRAARELADLILDRFWDEDEGVFYDAPADGEPLVVRPRSVDDNPIPSGNSAATSLLLRLSAFTGEPRYERIALRVLRGLGGFLGRAPLAFGHLLGALDFHTATPQEVAIIGEGDDAATRALIDVVRDRYRPTTILAVGRAADGEPAAAQAEIVPLLADRVAIDGRATAYVCRRFVCQRPVTEPDALRQELSGL
jgi:uncharacterized protein